MTHLTLSQVTLYYTSCCYCCYNSYNAQVSEFVVFLVLFLMSVILIQRPSTNTPFSVNTKFAMSQEVTVVKMACKIDIKHATFETSITAKMHFCIYYYLLQNVLFVNQKLSKMSSFDLIPKKGKFRRHRNCTFWVCLT